MKKHVIVFVLLATSLLPIWVPTIGSGETIICGYVAEDWFSYPCIGPWPMDTCDGYRVFLWDPPENYKGHYMMLVNPIWGDRCDEACGGCDTYIVDCEESFYISSCAECRGSDDPCEFMFCGEECFGCDLWMTECVNGDCVKDYIIERNSKSCGCGDPCEDVTCNPECFGCDYWAMECDDGDCVKDYIIEEDSKRCGCGDPCKGKDCPPECFGCDYWAMECDDGDCVKDYIIEEDSKRCGCGEKEEIRPKPEPEPDSGVCLGTNFVCIIVLSCVLLKSKR